MLATSRLAGAARHNIFVDVAKWSLSGAASARPRHSPRLGQLQLCDHLLPAPVIAAVSCGSSLEQQLHSPPLLLGPC